MRNLIISCIALGLAIPAAAAPRFGGGFGPRIGPRFGAGFGFGPAWGFGPGWGYSPYLYGGPATGGLKVETQLKDAAVYINGGYAGTVGSVKTLRLRPGAYDVEVKHPGKTRYAERVYVVAGRTLKLNPELREQP